VKLDFLKLPESERRLYIEQAATNGGGTSAASAVASATTSAASTSSGVPAAASNLAGRRTSSSVALLNWQDNSNNESGFRILYSVNGSTWYTLGSVAANTTSVQVSGLSATTTYYFRVQAYNAAGSAAVSNTAAV
jgi:hypothetical protein